MNMEEKNVTLKSSKILTFTFLHYLERLSMLPLLKFKSPQF